MSRILKIIMQATIHKISKTAAMREVQRNYKTLFDWVRATKKPLVLMSGSTPYVVVLNIDAYNALIEQAEKKQQENIRRANLKKQHRIEEQIKQIRNKGDQNASLADFIIQDRERH